MGQRNSVKRERSDFEKIVTDIQISKMQVLTKLRQVEMTQSNLISRMSAFECYFQQRTANVKEVKLHNEKLNKSLDETSFPDYFPLSSTHKALKNTLV